MSISTESTIIPSLVPVKITFIQVHNTLDGRSLNILFKSYKMNFARLLMLSGYVKFSDHQNLYIHIKSEFHHLIHFCHKWCSLIPRHVGVFFLRLLTGNLCVPILKSNNVFLSVQEGFQYTYLQCDILNS